MSTSAQTAGRTDRGREGGMDGWMEEGKEGGREVETRHGYI